MSAVLIITLKIYQALYFLNRWLWQLFLFAFTFFHINGTLKLIWICYPVFLSLIIHAFFVFFLTVSTLYPLYQKIVFSYLYFKLLCLSKIMKQLFPFKSPTISDNTVFGQYTNQHRYHPDNILPLSFLLLFFHIIV